MQNMIDWREATQGAHKQAPLKRMKAGDGLIYYSPREAYPDGWPGFVPWRIDVDYRSVQPAPIKPWLA